MGDLVQGVTDFDRKELQKCAVCRRGVMHDGQVAWYEVKIAQVVADIRSIREQAGLELQMGGNAALAAIMAPTTKVGSRLPATRLLICQPCFMGESEESNGNLLLAMLLDRSDDDG
jgi:hypothetical protein